MQKESDQEEFYQLLTYADDMDLNEKLAEWERILILHRPLGAFQGKTPYKALRCRLDNEYFIPDCMKNYNSHRY